MFVFFIKKIEPLLLFVLFAEGFAHIGEKCFLGAFCRARNSHCDYEGICQCNSGHPVILDPHLCARARGYKEPCKDSKECSYTDENMYCNQQVLSICECYDDFLYKDSASRCVKIKEKRREPDVLLPMVVGISVAVSFLLCFFLALWRICKGIVFDNNSNQFRRYLRVFQSNAEQERPEVSHSQRRHGQRDTLPSYEAALSLQAVKQPGEPDDQPPPPYEEAIKNPSVVLETKV